MKLENMKKESEFMDQLVDMLSETGEIAFKIMKEKKILVNKSSDVVINIKENEKLKQELLNIFIQFNNIIDDFIKENNIKME